MLRFYAARFVTVMDSLAVISTWQIGKSGSEGDIPSPAFYDEMKKRFRDLEDQLTNLKLRMAAKQAKRIVDELDAGTPISELAAAMDDLRLRVKDELETIYAFALNAAQADLYEPSEPLFGKDVNDKFTSTAYDIAEAGKCCALHRSTACVFHLMRVLERGLVVFADTFGVPSNHANWHNIIEGIEKKVRDIGNDPNRATDWKDQQEFYSQAASNFMLFKDAWRNYTAHVRGKYTEEEAEIIFISVRAFMQKLATRLHE